MSDKLKPCPLCGTPDPRDVEYGIQCNECGLWLGRGTQAMKRGGYKAMWNTRADAMEHNAVCASEMGLESNDEE